MLAQPMIQASIVVRRTSSSYWSPNWNGFVFRFAQTAGNRDETTIDVATGEFETTFVEEVVSTGLPDDLNTGEDDRFDVEIREIKTAVMATHELDPVIRSSSLAYTNGPVWAAVTWQEHEDWTAASIGTMESSDAESFRIAGRYIMDMGDGMSVQVSAMYEDLEY